MENYVQNLQTLDIKCNQIAVQTILESTTLRVCEKRLRHLNKKLVHENLNDDYSSIFAEYERKQIIEEVPEKKI